MRSFIHKISAAVILTTGITATGQAALAQKTISGQTLSIIPYPQHIVAYSARWTLPAQVGISVQTQTQRDVATFSGAVSTTARYLVLCHVYQLGLTVG